jgi:acetyl-CoA acyltransferase
MGSVIMEIKTSNIAREIALNSGIPHSVPASTVTQACISSNLAITTAAEKILSGQCDIVVAGGCETFSDVPIRYSKPIRQRLLQANKLKKGGIPALLPLLKGLKGSDFIPEAPAIANYTTGEVMGHSSDRLSAKFNISRADMDNFTVLSHTNAAKAHKAGLYKQEIIPVDGSVEENGIKGDSTVEKVSKLPPAFIKPHGTHTAANSSFLTDGASACLVMSEEKALELGFTPKAYLRAWTYVGSDPFEELLLGPTYAAKKVLQQTGLSLNEIDVLEIHEAFAGQVLSNIAAMESESFAKKNFTDGKPVGKVDFSKLNTQGGSLSIGHPFGATGARLVTTASNRLFTENGRYALLAACADGGLATAAVLERYGK